MILAAVAAAVLQPQTVFTVDPGHRLIEGIATDGSTIWLSSLIDRQLLACRKSCSTIATVPGELHPFAITWDSRRKRLWVAADCPPNVSFIKACERGALLGYDRRGRLRTRIAPPLGVFHPGDVSASNGQVFVSDSQNGAVYRLTSNGRALTALVPPGVGKSGQGSALDQTGGQLMVADYSQGVTVVDLSTGKRTLLKRDDGRPIRGIDGMVRCGSDYYAVYNGQAPGAVLRLTVKGDAISYTPLIDGAPLVDPTQIAVDGNRLLVVANAGWEIALKGAVRTEGTPILSVPLPNHCRNDP